MFDNVIVGVDGRQGGQHAIGLAKQLAAPQTRITLAHVYDGSIAGGRAAALAVPLELESAERLLKHAVRQFPMPVDTATMYESSVGRGLHELAQQREADLLVVGSCHRGTVGRAVLGDDTKRTLTGAPCAVAIAPAGYADRPHPMREIGVGYDGSPASQHALGFARKLAGELRTRLSAFEAVYGPPGEELALYSASLDLLVIGSRSYGPIGRLVHGSTAHYLARRARCPLLVLPRSASRAVPHETGNSEALRVGTRMVRECLGSRAVTREEPTP